MYGPFTFDTTLHVEVFGVSVEAEITYTATPDQVEGRYMNKRVWDIEVIEAKYTQFGVEVFAEGKLWEQLKDASQEAAEDHFFETRRAA